MTPPLYRGSAAGGAVVTDRAQIAAALQVVPAHDREVWVSMGMAVKSGLGDDGFDLWNEWGKRCDSYREADASAVWRSIKTNGKTTIGTLFFEAQKYGFGCKPNGAGGG